MLFFANASDPDPVSLATMCMECICRNLSDVFPENALGYNVKDDVVLPRALCESLIEMYQSLGFLIDDKFVNLFSNKQKSYLQKVTIMNSTITDEGLRKILHHNLRELELSYCNFLTSASLDAINEYGKNLRSLSIGRNVNIIQDFSTDRGYIFNTPNLTKLVLHGDNKSYNSEFYKALLGSLPKLTYLDLSSFELNNLDSFSSPFSYCPNITFLGLYNCYDLKMYIPSICQLTKLRHLDISQYSESRGMFMDENKVLEKLVTSLPHLVSLDISRTNLAGTGNVQREFFDETQEYHSDIPGLISRVKNPLEFLGLYDTRNSACKRHDIPAIKISGDANEEQILTAGTVYMNRPDLLQRVLRDIFHLVRTENCKNMQRTLQIVIDALNNHAHEAEIQVSGSAALYYIIRKKSYGLLTRMVKNLVITTLLNSMTLFVEDETVLRNGCLTLCQFRIPQDILFVYEKLVNLFLNIIMNSENAGFAQRMSIYLMNSLACQVNDTQKELLGNLGIIEKMLNLINNRIEIVRCDDVMEVAWSTMWNVTDETPVNCRRFLDNGGMTCFIHCLQKFCKQSELMRNMMGLLGNVAEVKELRPNLMPYITIFYDLIDSDQVDSDKEGIEVSYNAAGIISHIASDGPDAWEAGNVSREEVLTKMVKAIERWNLSVERNINYRSFEPILRLTRVRHTPQCQHWAIWALANLTKVYPDKYCPILEAENGLKDVQALIDADENTYPAIKVLAQKVLENYRQHKMVENDPNRKKVDDIIIPE